MHLKIVLIPLFIMRQCIYDIHFKARYFMEKVIDILQQHNFQFKKNFGQNFITDKNLLQSIVALSGIDKGSTVVEIGVGAGTLTAELAKIAKEVYAFEIDKSLQPILEQTLQKFDNIQLQFADFLKIDFTSFEEKLPPYTVVANLPYYITTPLIMQFIEESQKVEKLYVMVQLEVAERICSKENTAEYGAITAIIAQCASAKIVKKVPKQLFTPMPKVDSAILELIYQPNRIAVKDVKTYKKTVKTAFSNRRKMLANNLGQSFGLPKEVCVNLLVKANLPATIRGEALSPMEFANLSDILFDYLTKKD